MQSYGEEDVTIECEGIYGYTLSTWGDGSLESLVICTQIY
jgi:hypothetical protein